MKNIILYTLLSLIIISACESIYDKQAVYEGEIIYPAKYDTIIGYIGFERVEIDLLKAGRIPGKSINLGKAIKTRIEYDDEVIEIDSLVSFVNIEGLNQSKLYRFKVYTEDEYGNRSVPQEIALIPFTQDGLNGLAAPPPRILSSPSAAVIEWPSGISSVLMDYYKLQYSYTDRDGQLHRGESGLEPRIFIGNLEPGSSITLDVDYYIVPKVNQEAILDTVVLTDQIEINMPTSSTPFNPVEQNILEKNGVSEFTAQGVAKFTKLTFPLHTNSLQDIFYFPNLKELDLTGGDIFEMPTLQYERNDVLDHVGGGKFAHFARRAGDINKSNYQTLKDLLELDLLEKIYYIPNSMGLDELLLPYVDEGIVELSEVPDQTIIDNKFVLDGNVQDRNWNMEIIYPAVDVPTTTNTENIYQITLKAKNSSFVLALPKEYQFNIEEYKFLKMDVFAPPKTTFSGEYASYQEIWPRFMNHMWSFAENSNFGQEYWDPGTYKLPDNQLEKWTEITIDLSEALGKHNRVIVLNIGGEPAISSWDPLEDIIFYFANIRFSKY